MASRGFLHETARAREARDAVAASPCGLVVFSGGAPRLLSVSLDAGRLPIGRDGPLGNLLKDERLSRRHCVIERSGAGWAVTDLGSRNGTYVDGAAVTGEVACGARAIVRAGTTIVLLCEDARAYAGRSVFFDAKTIRGPIFSEALDAAGRAAREEDTLTLVGERGTGKEIAARAFHAAGRNRSGPFVVLQASGAVADVDSDVRAANGGVLFLDDVAKLDPRAQAKLLHLLETTANVRLCVTARRDPLTDVAEGRLRSELHERLGSSKVHIAPLRDRREEIPWLIAFAITAAGASIAPHPKLVETCLLRPWPGNVRELVREVKRAAVRAMDEKESVVRAEHLRPFAGTADDGPRSS